MGMFVCGILTGLLISAMVQLVRCAVWFEKNHPEDDYWHRGHAVRSAGETQAGLQDLSGAADNAILMQEGGDGQTIG